MNLVFVVGRDYPNTDREFVAVLPDDQACATYLTDRKDSSAWRAREFRLLEVKAVAVWYALPPSPNLCHCRHDLRQDKHPADDVVLG